MGNLVETNKEITPEERVRQLEIRDAVVSSGGIAYLGLAQSALMGFVRFSQIEGGEKFSLGCIAFTLSAIPIGIGFLKLHFLYRTEIAGLREEIQENSNKVK